MKRFAYFSLLVILCLGCAQSNIQEKTIVNPVFDRTDAPELHVDKIVISNDSTLLYCTLIVEDIPKANVSKDTYIEDSLTRHHYYLDRSIGLPFPPKVRKFHNEEQCNIVLSFPSIIELKVFNLYGAINDKTFCIQGINIKDSVLSHTYSIDEVLVISDLAESYRKEENFEKAIEFYKEELEGLKYYFGRKSERLRTVLNCLAGSYFRIGNYEEGIKYGKETLELDQNSLVVTNEQLVYDYNILSHNYEGMGDYVNAINMANLSICLLEKMDCKDTELYAIVCNNLVRYNNDIGNYRQAYYYAQKALGIKKYLFGKFSESYAKSLTNLAGAESHLGDYDKSIIHLKESLTIYNRVGYENERDKAVIISNIANDYWKKGNYTEAIHYGEEAYKLYLKIGEIDVTCLSNLSRYYYDYAFSINYGKKFEDLIKKSFQYMHSAELAVEESGNIAILPSIYNNRACILATLGKLDDAIELEQEACELVNRSTLDYTNYLDNLSLFYLCSGDCKNALGTIKEALNLFEGRIKSNLQSLSKLNISNYWETINHWFYVTLPKFAYVTKDDELISLLYDKTALFAKGFLLNSNISIKGLMQKEKNNQIKKRFKTVLLLYSQLDSLSIYSSTNTTQINLTKERIREIEDYIASNSTAYQNYINELSCNWQSVRSKLGSADLAIEFIKCPLGLFNDSTMYVALTLKSGYVIPKLIPLFNEQIISENKIPLTQKDLYKLIWKPLEEELRGISNVYFSPSGLLYNIGVEYLPTANGKCISDKYNIYRLSSTMELVKKHPKSKIHNVALFGGISYDVTNESDCVICEEDDAEAPNSVIEESLVNRAGFDRLSSTQFEVEGIAEIVREKNVVSEVYHSERGSENNFKQLSGKDINILHMATHGMYIAPQYAKTLHNTNNFAFINLSGSKDVSGESTALTRSILVMAGGNRLPQRIDIPRNGNDGILTALEISRLDFSSVDLVVLSACQTALGDISDDGVLGLQRGFKKAGVNSILMSLNKVDDDATQILMVEFYKNLMAGKNKLQSLKDAQRHLRQVENGKYDKPEYWASFIMLDGLN